MPDITLLQGIILAFFAFLAGLIDSIAGGGGLIQLPAIMSVLPNAPVVFLLGTNKLSSSFGTALAVAQYSRKVKLDWKKILPVAVAAFFAGIAGAQIAVSVPNNWMRPIVIVLLVVVLIYTLFKKNLGVDTREVSAPLKTQMILGILAGLVIGLYDGFFGPGTGNFLTLAFIAIYGMNFLTASASIKPLNLATNIGALILFSMAGTIFVQLGLIMAVFNMLGSFVGVRLAVLKGSRFIRILFMAVVFGLLIKQTWDFLSI